MTAADRFLLDKRYIDTFNFKFLRFIGYFFYLLYKIIVSGARTAVLTLTGNARHVMLSYHGALDSDFKCNLLANSITLTPGTVTVNREGSDFLILQLIKRDASGNTADIAKLERRIQTL